VEIFMRPLWWCLPATLTGCGGCRDEPSPPPALEELSHVCAEPSQEETRWADSNQDDQVDIADAVYTLRHLLSGGPAPGCLAAQDLLQDELVDVGDALGVLYHLFVGNHDLPGGRPDCPALEPVAEVPCGPLGLALQAPAEVSGAGEVTFEASVWLRSTELDVQAWSFGASATGCTLTGTTEAGTASADVRLDPEGHRDMGFTRTDLVDGGLVHGTVLSWEREAGLPHGDSAWTLLSMTVSATAPPTGCVPCELALTPDLKGPGKKVPLVVASSGRSYRPPPSGVTVQICAE
jgi:hypothetical protein